MQRRGRMFLQQVFDERPDSAQKPPRIPQASLPAAMAGVFAGAAVSGSNAPAAAPSAVVEAAKLGGYRGPHLVESVAAACAECQFGRWADKLPLARIARDAVGGRVGVGDDALQRLSQLPGCALDRAVQAATCGVQAQRVRAQAEVCASLAAQRRSMHQPRASFRTLAKRHAAADGVEASWRISVAGRGMGWTCGLCRGAACLTGGRRAAVCCGRLAGVCLDVR